MITKHQEAVIGTYLANYPEIYTYEQILEAILDNRDEVTLWEPFETYDPQVVVDWMDASLHSLERLFPAAVAA